MKRQIGMAAAVCMMMSLMLSGCKPEVAVTYEPKQSGIFVMKDGRVKSAEIESFDNSGFSEERYKESELLTFVEDAVSTYNQEASGKAEAYSTEESPLGVSIESLTVENGMAELILDYTSGAEYMAFQGENCPLEQLMWYPAPEASLAGVAVGGMKDPSGKSIDPYKMMKSDKYFVVVVSGTIEVSVEGTIKAASENVRITDKHTAEVTGENQVILFK